MTRPYKDCAALLVILLSANLQSCLPKEKDYKDNTPTAGRLKVYYDEGLHLHVKNQARTFESQYPSTSVDLYCVSESEAVQALYNDSCEFIFISRDLSQTEKKAFAGKNFFPKYSEIAKSGIAVITNAGSPLKFLTTEQIKKFLISGNAVKDSAGKDLLVQAIFDRNNSSVLHYVLDTLLEGVSLSEKCSVLKSTIECINYVAENKSAVAFVDFAWLSDVDDSLSKANKGKIKFIGIGKDDSTGFALPGQSSFKLNTYPLTRGVYVFRKTGDFTIAKGFQSFLAGPKGQLTLLKQGLLPTRQAERKIEIKLDSGQTIRPD